MCQASASKRNHFMEEGGKASQCTTKCKASNDCVRGHAPFDFFACWEKLAWLDGVAEPPTTLLGTAWHCILLGTQIEGSQVPV